MKHFSAPAVIAVLVSVALASKSAPGEAQASGYVGVAIGSAQLEPPGPQFALGWVRHPALALGYTSARGHGIELRVSRLDVETTERVREGMEAPYTFGIRATPLELLYHYQLSYGGDGRLRARFGVGVVATPLQDRWQSDTGWERATSFVYGGTASMGVTTRLVGAAAAVIRAAYHRVDNSTDRPARRIGLNGYRLTAGLEVGF